MNAGMNGKKVIVVGGGAAGLATTYELRKRGINVTLLEATARAGGRMAGEFIDGCHVETGAQLFHTSYTTALTMCAELEVAFDRSPVRMIAGLYDSRHDKFTEIDSSARINRTNIKTMSAFALRSPKAFCQFMRLAGIFLRRRNDFASWNYRDVLDLDIAGSFADFIRTHVGEECLEQFCEYPVSCTTLSRAERISPLHGLMLLWSVYFDPRYTLHMPEKGIGFFARALAAACADDTRLSTPVARVVIEDGVATGVIANRTLIEADAVVCATTASKVLTIVPDLPSGVREFIARVPYSDCCHVVFGVDGHPLAKGQLLFIFQQVSGSLLTCYLDSTVASPLSAPPGQGVIHANPTEDYSRELFALSDEEIKRRVIDEIRKHTPAMPEEPRFTRVYRWKDAVCLPYGGMMRDLENLRERGFPGVRGLFLAGEYLHMPPSINGALSSGVNAAAQVADYLTPQTGSNEKSGSK